MYHPARGVHEWALDPRLTQHQEWLRWPVDLAVYYNDGLYSRSAAVRSNFQRNLVAATVVRGVEMPLDSDYV